MNRRSFLKFAGLAPVVPMVAVEVLSSTPVVFDPNCLVGIARFASGRYAGTMEIQIDTVADIIRAAEIIKHNTGRFPPMYAISKENYERLNI